MKNTTRICKNIILRFCIILGEDQCCSVVDFENNLLLWFFGFIKPPVLETSKKKKKIEAGSCVRLDLFPSTLHPSKTEHYL
jgi:hypothetical protein